MMHVGWIEEVTHRDEFREEQLGSRFEHQARFIKNGQARRELTRQEPASRVMAHHGMTVRIRWITRTVRSRNSHELSEEFLPLA
jgi:hypothetical protein